MAPKKTPHQTGLLLPTAVVGRMEVTHLAREVEALENQAAQAAYHHHTLSASYSKLLTELADANQLKLTHADDRQQLLRQLTELKNSAPIIHFSFATEPSTTFLDKLINWLRQEIHPQLLLQVGLQPSITAGCMVRTTNKVYDFSLRQHLVEQKSNLASLLGGSREPS